ncbi:unnamed protein product, partial [Closterium sp. NIES-54]
MVQFMVPEQQRGGKLAPKARWGLHLGVSPESKGWEVLDLTNNKVVTLVEVIFYETLSLEPADEDVVEVLPPSLVLAPPCPVADRPALTSVSATGDEGSLEASPVAPASGIDCGRQGAKLVNQDGKPLTLVDDLAVDKEGELSAGEESIDSDVVEVTITKPELRCTCRARRPPEQLGFHACLPPAAFTTVYDEVDDDLLYDDAEEDEELPELDPDVHADPEHHWDIAAMTVKEAMASWKGEVVKAAMEEEIRSLIDMGTWELVDRPRRVCGADCDETYSPNAFLQSKLDKVLYMYQPDYFDDGTVRVRKLLKSLYGLKQLPLL